MQNFLLVFAIGLLVCLIGFYKYLYFISIGYGFSISAMGIVMFIIFRQNLNIGIILLLTLLIIYGLRLGAYLLYRELKSNSYRDAIMNEVKSGGKINLVAKFSTWVGCAFLYVLQVSPVLFRLTNDAGFDIFGMIGIAVMLVGIVVESLADNQKAKAKKENPSRFCDKKLYRIVRCPNYFGEILFWTGVFVSGISIYNSLWQWALALLGYLCIVYIMFGGARRLEIRQNKNYGDDIEYRDYIKKTPIIIPGIPLYSVEKYKWLIG